MTEHLVSIHDLLHHCWNHSKVITLRLRDGSERRGNVAEKPAPDADWVSLHEHSRYHTVPMKTHLIRIDDVSAADMME
ncbi:MAG: hypothetical protein ACRDTZ_04650 [Pseudonocardiaceae bacterium]